MGLLDAALSYAKKGWPVIPLWWPLPGGKCACGMECDSPGKHPIIKNWTSQGTTDETTIRQWFGKWPKANLGILTGERSGILLLDVDLKDDGPDNLSGLEAKHGKLPDTIEAITGSGGRHVLFKYPRRRVILNRARFHPGLDTRSNGGMFVAAPSLHSSGRQYEWDAFFHPDTFPLADAPEWLLDLMSKAPERKTSTDSPINEKIQRGQRNSALTSLAGSMRNRGMSENAIMAALKAENKARCVPPLKEVEIKQIAKSVSRYEPGKVFTKGEKKKFAPIITCLKDVEPEDIHWLWEPYIPLKKITLMEGDPGVGKTWAALTIASAVSTGAPFPSCDDGKPKNHREPLTVLYLTAEDGIGDTLRPRLDAVGADVSRVFVLSGGIDEEGNQREITLGLLESATAVLNPALIVIDPLQAFLGAGVDMHRANEVRPFLSKLASIAETHNCAVVCLRHLAKASASKALYRGLGSIDFAAAARSVLLVGADPNNPGQRGIVHVKSSLAPIGPSIGYELRNGQFFWTGVTDLTAATLLQPEPVNDEEKGALDEAKEWLKNYLADGPKSSRDVLKNAREAGFSEATIRRGKTGLNIRVEKSGLKGVRGGGNWQWSIGGRSFLVEDTAESWPPNEDAWP